MDVRYSELKSIAKNINVIRDPIENEVEWKRRLVYSICGRMTLASLWDSADNHSVSVQHLKNRCKEILKAYESLYPEIVSETDYGNNDSEIVECIYNLYYQCGQFYHKRNRLSPSKHVKHIVNNVLLVKGLYATDTCFMSGLGPYLINEQKETRTIINSFKFCHPDPKFMFDSIHKHAKWHEVPTDVLEYSFLKTMPPYKNGYWTKRTDRDCGLSLMRFEGNGQIPKQYFLIKIEDGKVLFSELPEWVNKNRMHVYFALEILKSYDSLPNIIIKKHTKLFMIEIPYRLPPEEENLLKLYSWPSSYDGKDRPFKRIVSIELYDAIRCLFTQTGFNIQEEKA